MIGLVFWVCSVGGADAHRPAFPNGQNTTAAAAFPLDDVDISQVIYQVLRQDEQVWLSFDPLSSDSQMVSIVLGMPALEENSSFRPSVAVVAPNLVTKDVPFDLPEGFGAIVYEPAIDPIREYYEPRTQTRSWIVTDDVFQLDATGVHYVVIFSKSDQSGKFWFVTGHEEVWDVSDRSESNNNFVRIRDFHSPTAPGPNDGSTAVKEVSPPVPPTQDGSMRSASPYLIIASILVIGTLLVIRKRRVGRK